MTVDLNGESVAVIENSSQQRQIRPANQKKSNPNYGIMKDELNTIINSLLDKRDRFQTIVVVLICLNSIIIGINHTLTTFHTYEPKFKCLDDLEASPCELYVNETLCPSGFVFNTSDDDTVTVEWSLVCNRKFIATTVTTLYFVGVTFGAFFCGILADVWGRKKMVFMCVYAQAIMAIGTYFSDSLTVFIVFRVLQGFFVQGVQSCSYTLMLEYSPPQLRTAAAVLWEINWAFGLGILGFASYFIRDWRILTLVLLAPAALSLLYFWMIPESIKWLFTKGRYREAFILTYKIAKKNKNIEIIQECDKIGMSDRYDGEVKGYNTTNEQVKRGKITDIIRCAVLRKHLFIIVTVWFSVTLSYYGVLNLLPNLSGHRHLNFLIGAAIEVIAYIAAYFVFLNFGRRMPMTVYQLSNCALLIIMGLVSNFVADSPAKETSITILALIAKGLAVSSFCGMFIYGSELFPTICRGSAIGLCGLSARCGSLLASPLMFMVTFAPEYSPILIMAACLLISGSSTLLLPETLRSRLPNTIDEANDLWAKS